MADTKVATEGLAAHKPSLTMVGFTFGLFVVAAGLDAVGGHAGLRTPAFFDILAGLVGALGVMAVLLTLIVVAIDFTL